MNSYSFIVKNENKSRGGNPPNGSLTYLHWVTAVEECTNRSAAVNPGEV